MMRENTLFLGSFMKWELKVSILLGWQGSLQGYEANLRALLQFNGHFYLKTYENWRIFKSFLES